MRIEEYVRTSDLIDYISSVEKCNGQVVLIEEIIPLSHANDISITRVTVETSTDNREDMADEFFSIEDNDERHP